MKLFVSFFFFDCVLRVSETVLFITPNLCFKNLVEPAIILNLQRAELNRVEELSYLLARALSFSSCSLGYINMNAAVGCKVVA